MKNLLFFFQRTAVVVNSLINSDKKLCTKHLTCSLQMEGNKGTRKEYIFSVMVGRGGKTVCVFWVFKEGGSWGGGGMCGRMMLQLRSNCQGKVCNGPQGYFWGAYISCWFVQIRQSSTNRGRYLNTMFKLVRIRQGHIYPSNVEVFFGSPKKKDSTIQ